LLIVTANTTEVIAFIIKRIQLFLKELLMERTFGDFNTMENSVKIRIPQKIQEGSLLSKTNNVSAILILKISKKTIAASFQNKYVK
jgi:hypothetical protein